MAGDDLRQECDGPARSVDERAQNENESSHGWDNPWSATDELIAGPGGTVGSVLHIEPLPAEAVAAARKRTG